MNFKPYIQCEAEHKEWRKLIKEGKEALRSGGGKIWKGKDEIKCVVCNFHIELLQMTK